LSFIFQTDCRNRYSNFRSIQSNSSEAEGLKSFKNAGLESEELFEAMTQISDMKKFFLSRLEIMPMTDTPMYNIGGPNEFFLEERPLKHHTPAPRTNFIPPIIFYELMIHVIDTLLQQPNQKLQINLAPGEAEDLKSSKTAFTQNCLKEMTHKIHRTPLHPSTKLVGNWSFTNSNSAATDSFRPLQIKSSSSGASTTPSNLCRI
jgi:hypothetical protein